MRSSLALVGLVSLLLLACNDDRRPGPMVDGGPMRFDGSPTDAPPMIDSGPPDAGPPDAGPSGCNPETGIECDGDWAERCSATCPAEQCCSPFMGSFSCRDRTPEGACPAADIWIDESRITGRYEVEWAFFPDDDCAIVEGCVDGSGWRRLLRFDTWTPNTGDADLYLGPPSMSIPYFEYSDCHAHYHFNSYARYELRGDGGSVAAEGHKQAFCLLDFYRYPGTDNRGDVYSCGNQGIQSGWQDVYGRDLDCQWIDVTDVDPGDYMLHIDLNFEHILAESDYTNNSLDVPVTITPDVMVDDVTVACPSGTEGPDRDCGFTREGTHTCTAGAMVTVGCSSACGLGSCSGDSIIRACNTTDDPACSGRAALATNDDSGCGSGACGRGGDCCSQATFTCPPSGEYVVFTGAYAAGTSVTCTVATR